MALRPAIFAILLAAAGSAEACMWDRDTLGMQANRFPDIIQVITGRFERNPPLYFQMRADRVRGELKTHPERLALYDDIGVALDRLGKDDEAIHWMELKRRRPELKSDKEAQYRTEANEGTFLVHQFLRAGKAGRLENVKRGRDMIAAAIAINPNAHFGREVVQLEIIDWLIAGKTTGKFAPLGEGEGGEDRPLEEAKLKGLAGIVVLGGGWESPDIFAAMARLLGSPGKGKLAQMALDREKELIRSGHPKLSYDQDEGELPGVMVSQADQQIANEAFRDLRNEADQWQKEREAYMMERLKAGRHPDTDPHFWDQYIPKPPPVYHDPLGVLVREWINKEAEWVALGVLVLIVALLIKVTRWVRRTLLPVRRVR